MNRSMKRSCAIAMNFKKEMKYKIEEEAQKIYLQDQTKKYKNPWFRFEVEKGNYSNGYSDHSSNYISDDLMEFISRYPLNQIIAITIVIQT
jgi:hypothetical protein